MSRRTPLCYTRTNIDRDEWMRAAVTHVRRCVGVDSRLERMHGGAP